MGTQVETQDNGISGKWRVAVVGRRARRKYKKWDHWSERGSPFLAITACCVFSFLVLTVHCVALQPSHHSALLTWELLAMGLPVPLVFGVFFTLFVGCLNHSESWGKSHWAVVTEFLQGLEQLTATRCSKSCSEFVFNSQSSVFFCWGVVDGLGSSLHS